MAELGQGLAAHSISARNVAGQRTISFDQWAQLFDWISHQLSVTTAAAFSQHFGAELHGTSLAQARQALSVRATAAQLACISSIRQTAMRLHQDSGFR